MSIGVEARTAVELAKTSLYPAAMSYLSHLAGTIHQASALGVDLDTTTLKAIGNETDAMLAAANELAEAISFDDFDTLESHMRYCADTIRPLMDKVRVHADHLETEVADEYWPLPKYREMLFIK